MAKEITNIFKLQIKAGKANPAPPIGPILGQNGINIQAFCTEFNAKTAQMGDDEIPVVVTVFKDKSFKMVLKQPTVAGMIKKKFRIEKGSATPNKEKVAKIKRKDLVEIAEKKMPDLNTKIPASALKIVEGTAKSMGAEVID